MSRLIAAAWVGAVLAGVVPGAACGGGPPGVRLALDGKARMPVVVGEGVSERVKRAAGELAGMLGRITGAGFEVVAGDGPHDRLVAAPGGLHGGPVVVGRLAGDVDDEVRGLPDQDVREVREVDLGLVRARPEVYGHLGGRLELVAVELPLGHLGVDLVPVDVRQAHQEVLGPRREDVPRVGLVAVGIVLNEVGA